MNKTHRTLWNPALGAWVAAPETARARGKQGRSGLACRAIGVIGVIGAMALGAVVVPPAQAQSVSLDGGSGGRRDISDPSGGAGGTSASPDGSSGAYGSFFDYGGGGGGGGVGLSTGAGGKGGSGGDIRSTPITVMAVGAEGGSGGNAVNTTQWNNTVPLTGQAGGDGSAGADSGDGGVGGGGGGGGGFGLVLSGTGPASNASSIVGGQGGAGALGGILRGTTGRPNGRGGGGGGGAGGGGLLLLGDVAYANRGSIAGGSGGASVYDTEGALFAGGGDGGMGMALTGGGALDNQGSITGGAGGASGRLVECDCGQGGAGVVLTAGGAVHNSGTIDGGAGGPVHRDTTVHAGGAGLLSTGNVSVSNAGHIGGGLSGDGLTRANAIDFFGGGNTLTLHAGYSFTGHVVSHSGGDGFALGGDTSPAVAFDVSRLVNSLPVVYSGTQFVGFANLAKTGTSTWLLTGTGSAGLSWAIADGALQGDVSAFGGDIVFTPASPTSTPGVVFDQASDASFAHSLSGNGRLTKMGAGTLTLDANNAHTGGTVIESGTLRAGAANRFSAASAHRVVTGATLDLAGFDQRVAGLDNSGTVSLLGTAPGTTLTVTGAYVGNSGLLRLGTSLGDSASASDRLLLDGAGASASGRTTVEIVNLAGLGAQTTGDGIEVIAARNGATTTAQTTRDAFALQGDHVDAGAFEYRLHAGDANGAGESWFLRSTTNSPIPGNSGTPPTTYRVEVPLFAALPAQLREGNLAMLGSLRQRRGHEPQRGSGGEAGFSLRQLALNQARAAAPAPAASEPQEREAWVRVLGSRLRIEQGGTVDPSSKGRLSGLQAGTDLWAEDQWRAGVYAGQLDGAFDVHGFAQGTLGTNVGGNRLSTQYLGAYATWTQPDGFYVDAVLQSGQHRYTVQPLGNPDASAKATSLSGAVEVGRALPLTEGWQVELQVQLVHQRTRFDDIGIAGAQVQQDRRGSWLLRAGARIEGELPTAAGRLRPYASLNLHRDTGEDDSTYFVNPFATTAITSDSGGNVAELAMGFDLALNTKTSLHASLERGWSLGHRPGVQTLLQGSLGLRVRW